MKTIVLCACLLWIPATSLLCAADAAPASPPPATRPLRPASEIIRDSQDNSRRLGELLPSPRAIIDADRRTDIAPLAIPLLWRGVRLADELAVAEPASRDDSLRRRFHLLAILAFLDDPAALAELTAATESSLRQTAMLARDATLLAQWWRSGNDPKAQSRILEGIALLAKDSPTDDGLTHVLAFLRDEGAADDTIVRQIESIIIDQLRGLVAAKLSEQFKIHAKLRAMVDKPLVVSGTRLDGKAFTTASLTGKVIVVDFGATWCQPWTEQLAELRELYLNRDGRGLAMVTVLCDENVRNVQEFVERQPLAWPILRDPKDPTGFAAQYGVELFPTVFIIDRKGVLRHVDAAGKLRILAEQLLQEPPADPATRPADPPR